MELYRVCRSDCSLPSDADVENHAAWRNALLVFSSPGLHTISAGLHPLGKTLFHTVVKIAEIDLIRQSTTIFLKKRNMHKKSLLSLKEHISVNL